MPSNLRKDVSALTFCLSASPAAPGVKLESNSSIHVILPDRRADREFLFNILDVFVQGGLEHAPSLAFGK